MARGARRDGLRRVAPGWKQLRTKLHSDKLHCSYVAVAGAKGDGSTAGAIAKAFDFAPPATNWFYLIARCPTINTVFFARSGADRVESKPLSSL